MTGISLSELARRIGRDKGQLSRLAKAGRIPRGPDGSFDEAAMRQLGGMGGEGAGSRRYT